MPTVAELKSMLKARGLSTSGKKAELEARLEAYDNRNLVEIDNGGDMFGDFSNGPLTKKQKLSENYLGVRQNLLVHQPSADNTVESDYKQFFSSLSHGSDQMDAEQTLEFCEKLEIDPEAAIALSISYYFKSPNIGVFKQNEFIEGAKQLRVSNLESLRKLMPVIEKNCSWGGKDFENVYKFAFTWGCDPGIRNIKKEVAIGLWKLLIPKKIFPILDEWEVFWNDRKQSHMVTKDEWNSFRRFISQISKTPGGVTAIELDDAWPLAIEEFAEKMKLKFSSAPILSNHIKTEESL